MEVSQAGSNSYYLSDQKQREPSKTLDKDAFLQIMIAQLRNQDPTSPMDSTQFINQMAMFTTLEQMTNLNSNMEKLYHLQELNHASSLIGKQVNLIDGEEQLVGEVERVTMGQNSVNIWVSGQPYSLDQVMAVERGGTNEPEELPEVPNDVSEQPTGDASEAEPSPDEENSTDEPSEPVE
ncbi:hypothetical protein JCM14036_15120 [Desulfotomaculum defluvii]